MNLKSQSPSSKRVLVVEDNELNLKLFTDLLEANDYTVFQNKTGIGVIEFCKMERPNLIIMDIQLPNISGIDLIEQLKVHEDLSTIPIIAVTAFAMQGDKQSIMSAGCEEYLSKPISIGIFLETIKKYI